MTTMTLYALIAAIVILAMPLGLYLLRVFSKKQTDVPTIRPSFDKQPPLRPAMLVEVVDGGYLLGPRVFCCVLPPGFEKATGAFPEGVIIQGKPHIYVRPSADWMNGKFPDNVVRYVDGIKPPEGWWRAFTQASSGAEGEAL